MAQVSPNKKFYSSQPSPGVIYGGCDVKRSAAVEKDKVAFCTESLTCVSSPGGLCYREQKSNIALENVGCMKNVGVLK